MITLNKYTDLIIDQIDIKRAPLIFISFGCLLLMACYLYGIKPSLNNYYEKKDKVLEAPGIENEISKLDNQIAIIEKDINDLELEFNNIHDNHGESIISHTINLLNTISVEQNVTLKTVTPNKIIEYENYDVTKFAIKISGPYQNLYNWLGLVQQKLPSHIFHNLEIQPIADGELCEVQLILKHYQIGGKGNA